MYFLKNRMYNNNVNDKEMEIIKMKYIFESTEKTLIETDNLNELSNYIADNIGELTQYDIIRTFDYMVILYYGYSLMIKI